MKVLILAAGYGTRLYPLTKDKPKPLLPIEPNKPLINYLVERVVDLKGLTEIFVISNDKFCEKFQQWAKSFSCLQIPVTIINDGTKTPEDRLGSIGDIDFTIKGRQVDDDILVIGGDNLFDFNIDEFLAVAIKQKEKVTLGVFDIKNIEMAQKFGVVAMDRAQAVTHFEEKPENPRSSLIAMCFYFMPKATLPLIQDYIVKGGKLDLAGDYIRWLCEQKRLCGFQFSGSWYDIGSLEAYREAQEAFIQHQ